MHYLRWHVDVELEQSLLQLESIQHPCTTRVRPPVVPTKTRDCPDGAFVDLLSNVL